MNGTETWWFDGEYGECYWAPGHVSKVKFAAWVMKGDGDTCEPLDQLVSKKDVEHIYVLELNAERFMPCPLRGDEYDDIKAHIKPMTRYRP